MVLGRVWHTEMARKILLTIFLVVLFVLAGNIVLADVGDFCCVPSDCTGDPGAGMEWACPGANLVPGMDCVIATGQNAGACHPVATGGGGGGGGGVGGMAECVKLPATVKLILPGDNSETSFEKDLVISPKPLSVGECRHSNNPVTLRCPAETSIGFDQGPCYTSEFPIVVALSYLNAVIKWMFIILMLLVSIAVIYGGFLYVTAAGSPDRAGRAKKVLLFAIVGFAIALLGRVIPALVRFIIGV